MASRSDGPSSLSRLLLIGALALAGGCRSSDPGPSTGSETHFLAWCSGPGSCGDGLECLCGVCTSACSETASCVLLAETAECVAAGTRSALQLCPEAPVATCDVSCNVDTDCAGLGAAHRCDRGFCRQLASECTTGLTAAGDVVVLGDSFLAESGQVVAELEALARRSGALAAEERYRDYSSTLVTPFGGAADLTTQYTAARDDGPIRVVIMNVGGPDALLGSCPEPPTADCPAITGAVAGAEALWQQMADDGVEAVVDFFYPDPADATLQARFDLLRPLLQATCSASPVSCSWLDLRPTFENRAGEYLDPSAVIPTQAGSVAAAEAIWSLMQRRCIAQ